ncbi:MAG: PKD domain-containing protein [Acidimicrobiales bacterium]
MIRRVAPALVVLAVVAAACGSEAPPRPALADGIVVNNEPIIVIPNQSVAIDLDGDGVETVTLSAADSFDPDPGGEIVEYHWTRGLDELAVTPELTEQFDVGEHIVTVSVLDDGGLTDIRSTVVRVLEPYTGTPESPDIDLWQGSEIGTGEAVAQRWFDVLGNVSDPDGIDSLVYSLNGAVPESLSFGPNSRRLVREGDFVIDILRSDLLEGVNTVEIRAVDKLGEATIALVQIDNVTPENPAARDLPLTVDWSEQELQGLVEIVDGNWRIEGEEVVIDDSAAGYDRLLAIGDTSMADFDVTTTVTPVALLENVGPFSNTPGFGYLLRWTGHSNSTTPNSQPLQGFRPDDTGNVAPIGGFSFYTFDGADGRLEMQDQAGEVKTFDESVQVRVGSSYRFRAQVQSYPGGAVYRAKLWSVGAGEPGWQVSSVAGQGTTEPPSGSLVLVAHEMTVRFGAVEISPIAAADRLTIDEVNSLRLLQS